MRINGKRTIIEQQNGNIQSAQQEIEGGMVGTKEWKNDLKERKND
ncbi:MAG: hypothetical protein PF541_00585 [Prolixibacteraceae bacterium]|nr:hypothetical protein [Prolixibacteraceae bacterium]